MTLQTNYLMPYMITQINNEIDLLTHLREYERIANGQNQETECMRSFMLFWIGGGACKTDIVGYYFALIVLGARFTYFLFLSLIHI